MSDQPFDAALDERVQRIARQMVYPPTPDLARRLSAHPVGAGFRPARLNRLTRRWALAALGLLVVIAALMAVPPVRAAVLEFIRIGAVRILVGEPTLTPPPTVTPRPTGTGAASRPQPTGEVAELDRLYGETTLDAARASVPYPIKLPAYPADLGEPDRVYRQNFARGSIILVWVEPGDPGQVRLSLHILTDESIVYKFEPKLIQSTTVNGEKAVWLEGPYPIMVTGQGVDDMIISQLMAGKSLVWTEPATGLTYRLETDFTLEEAIKIAESLR